MVEKREFKTVTNIVYECVATIIEVFFILMFSYAMAEVFMATGVGASIIRIVTIRGLSQSVLLVGFLVTVFYQLQQVLSMGNFAACAPIFLWANHIVGGVVPYYGFYSWWFMFRRQYRLFLTLLYKFRNTKLI